MPSTARDDLEVAKEVGRLINMRQFREAALLGASSIGDRPFEIVAFELGFQTALAGDLARLKEPPVALSDIDRFYGYDSSPNAATDTCRDLCLSELRRGNIARAKQLHRKARGFALDCDDSNRRIVLEYVTGRIAGAQGLHNTALRQYRAALEAWSQIKDADPQWVLDCQFWLLRSQAVIDVLPGRWHDTLQFVRSERSTARRVAAWAYALTGWLAASNIPTTMRQVGMIKWR